MRFLKNDMNQDKSKKKKGKTVNETIEMVFEQLEEDRKKITASYEHFSEKITEINDYVVAGQNLNKCLELMTKQTAQLLDVAKLLENKKQRSNEIDEEDVAQIYGKLENERNSA